MLELKLKYLCRLQKKRKGTERDDRRINARYKKVQRTKREKLVEYAPADLSFSFYSSVSNFLYYLSTSANVNIIFHMLFPIFAFYFLEEELMLQH